MTNPSAGLNWSDLAQNIHFQTDFMLEDTHKRPNVLKDGNPNPFNTARVTREHISNALSTVGIAFRPQACAQSARQLCVKGASTHTDGGMLWWLPPTLATLALRVEKSRSRHARHALDTTLLRSTCIFWGGKKRKNNTLLTRNVRVFGGLLRCHRGYVSSPTHSSSPEIPSPTQKNHGKVERCDE